MSSINSLATFQQLVLGCQILRAEASAVTQLAERLDSEFCAAVDHVLNCSGTVIVSGMGKAGLIGRKITATLASTGTRSHFLHPAEALHGDLGEVGDEDVVIMLSNSGGTEEILRLLPSLQHQKMIAITGRPESELGRTADVVLNIGRLDEAGDLKLAPSTSTTAMLALGDALALVVSEHRGFEAEDFARLHPAGSLGRKLAIVDDIMRPFDQCRIALESQTVREVLISKSQMGRRTGAILLTNEAGRLTGIFTDSDLARLFEAGQDDALDAPISKVMTRSPHIARSGAKMTAAVELLVREKISELPIVQQDHVPIGMIDITDVVAYLPAEQTSSCFPPTLKSDPPNQRAKSA